MTKLYTSPPRFSQVPDVIREDVPIYRLRTDIFVDDTLLNRGSTIETDMDYIPCEGMFPLNDLALEAYRAFLTECDKLGKKREALPIDKRNGFLQVLPKLPAFEREWLKVNNLAKNRRMHLCHAVDSSPSILGAPAQGAPKVRKVDMSSVPTLPYVDNTVIGKGNTADKDMLSAFSAVQTSLPVS